MIRAYHDNVIIELEPLPTETKGGIVLPQSREAERRGHRMARVVASGPGYYTRLGAFVPNETKPGDRVIVDALAGQNYDFDFHVPRHNKPTEVTDLFRDGGGHFRIVRESGEILGIVED